MADDEDVLRLEEKIAQKTRELEILKNALREKKRKGLDQERLKDSTYVKDSLPKSDIARYSRQLILPEIGVQGQKKLKNASVLIVGTGGLGCPAALYLAAAGVGCIGLVDYDDVDLSNLHRQVLHSEERVNTPKVLSGKQALNNLNSKATVNTYDIQLGSSNALEIISKYDVVVDASDNVATRYLLNDACVICKKPLVSGSALRFEGQLTVYNHEDGPCYRCLFPNPPPPETVGNCSDNGVLGAVPGVIGTLQAIEVIKIICGLKSSFAQKMLVFDALEGRFLQVKLRNKKISCCVCGEEPTINELIDYEEFCGASATDKTKSLDIIKSTSRITAKEYKDILKSDTPHILLDVREPVELEICCLPNAYNVPLRQLSAEGTLDTLHEKILSDSHDQDPIQVFVVCKQGNDSQKAVKVLQKSIETQTPEETSPSTSITKDSNTQHTGHKKVDLNQKIKVKDIKGGLLAWAKQVDNDFPVY
ncbi:adenylyltransferase and sulfurtransferase MOCS3-like isoform X2 [Actinia tenebrosa]|uniref:Adenylyltransferase and sulfurtransferase MOCS3 homolog n=1 Tax=Actinia tenebrosa TaxID=6105 RepID=A0A6P8I6F3_ACTTE|nr:adenylyltransferase and sulfurtransferase MOCS3-like isoform X2 [Actinia tenebrosa]